MKPDLKSSNPLKALIADRIYEAIKELETRLLPKVEGINAVEVRRLSDLRTEITVQRVANSPLKPRYFTVQVIEHF
jgi:hypothetical protein